MAIDLIDKKPIESYLERFLPDDPHALSLLKMALMTPLSKREENMALVATLPDDAPAWAHQKLAEGKQLYRFQPDHGLDGKVRHIADWINAAVVNSEPWLDVLDGPKPVRFKKLNTIELATAEADKDMRLAKQKLAAELKLLPVGKGEQEVMVLENGYRIVQLTTTTALDREGVEMGHCIGQGAYDKALKKGSQQFFSLRDSKNEPHATIELDTKQNAILQCQGKENKPPIEKYLPYLQNFLSEARYRLNAPASHTGLIEQDGVYHSIYDLPAHLVIKGDLDLRNTPITSLPKGLEVGGDLKLQNTPITSLPEGLKVAGDLKLRNTQITSLPKGLKVGDALFANSKITSLPEGMEVGGSLYLSNTSIAELPNDLKVGGSIYLEDAFIISLPEGLKVNGNLDISNTCINSLPEGLKVEGDLKLRNTQITSLPEGLEVAGDLDITGTKITQIPKSARILGKIISDPGQLITVEEAPPEKTQKQRNHHDLKSGGTYVDSWRKISDSKAVAMGRGGKRSLITPRERFYSDDK